MTEEDMPGEEMPAHSGELPAQTDRAFVAAVCDGTEDDMAEGGGEESVFDEKRGMVKQKKKLAPVLVLVALGCLVLFALTIVLTLALNNEDNNNRDLPPVSPTPTGSPSNTPDVAVTTFAPSSAPVGAPTPAPTPTPPTPTPPTPTIPTASAPTPSVPLTIVGGPFVGAESSNFGRSVAISALIMASGAPGSVTGETLLYQFAGGSWTELGSLAGEQANGGFGFDVSVTGNEVLIGAPFVFAEGTTTPVGVAYYYQIESDGTVVQVGSTIRGDEDFFAALESFGASLSASDSRRIVVGAPGSNIGGLAQAGRVYPFEYSDATQDWEPMQDIPLGGLESENLGVDVAISNDGSRFIAGAPSFAEGYFVLFEWDEGMSQWLSIAFEPGFEDREGFGSGVAIITDNGSLCAAGGPNFSGGRGVIRVYQSDDFGEYTQLGGDIVGDDGDALGIRNTFSGDGTAVVAGTLNGFVKRFEYEADLDEWIQVYDPIDTNYPFVTSLATTDAANTIAVAGNDEAVIYEALVV